MLNRTLRVRLLNDEGDGVVTPLDGEGTPPLVGSIDLADIAAGELIRINLTDEVRAALAAGQTRITLRLQLNSPNPSAPLQLFSPQDVNHRSALDVRVAQQDGVLADIMTRRAGCWRRTSPLLICGHSRPVPTSSVCTILSLTSKRRGCRSASKLVRRCLAFRSRSPIMM